MSVRAEINVTPLIDVMLVLLILFMIVAPSAPRGLDASVPAPAPSSAAPAPPATALVIAVGATSYQLNQAPVVSEAELEGLLRERLLSRTDRTVFVKAEPDVPSGRMVDAMDIARGAGAARIGLLLPD